MDINSSNKLRFLLSILFSLVTLLVLTFFITITLVNKGALLHELNSLHFKYVVKLRKCLEPEDPLSEMQEIHDVIKSIQKQPLQCLQVAGFLNPQVISWSDAQSALEICQRDVQQGEAALKLVEDYKAGNITEDDTLEELRHYAEQTFFNSVEFMTPVSRSISQITALAFAIGAIAGFLLIMGILVIMRSVLATTKKITESAEALSKSERKNRLLAYTDTLTSLPNRNQFDQLLSQWLKASDRDFALMFIDLDMFKHINDTLGHLSGDQLLKQLAQRLQNYLPETAVVARIGGDEFTVLLPLNSLSATGLRSLMDDLKIALSTEPFFIENREIYITVSIGVTLCPADGRTKDRLLRNADMAMHSAKESGKNCFAYFRPEMDIKLQRRVTLESQLREAINREEFFLQYQPIVDISDTTRLKGAEALIRWQPEDGKLIPPLEFIPLAEETGAIHAIGQWVINEACRQCATWRQTGELDFYISINVSVIQLRSGKVPEQLTQALERNHLPTSAIAVEVTESFMVERDKPTMESLRKLGEMGVRLLLDDFGTGYSSFAYLGTLPFDVIKIDKTFIDSICNVSSDLHIVHSIVSMAHKLSMQVVAEGVETEECLVNLQSIGCDYAQGYHFGRPVNAEQFFTSITPH